MKLVDLTFHTPADLGTARHSVRTALKDAGTAGDLVEDLLLGVSELMSNALRHTKTEHPRLEVDQASDGSFTVMVTDDSADRAPEMRPVDPGRVGGNGLRMIDAVSDHWGTIVHDGLGKSVWFEITAP